MNRRSFFSRLALAAPALFLPKALDHFQWKAGPSGVWVINPDWIKADHSLYYYVFPIMDNAYWQAMQAFTTAHPLEIRL